MFSRIVVALVLLWSSMGVARPAAGEVSYMQERELGQRFDMMAHERFPLVQDPEFVSYVEEIGQEVVERLDDSFFSYKFSVVRDSSINAFAVPGGFVYVNVGLLNRAKNDDEIAAVLGHEVAHVHAHHMARQQDKTQLMSYAALLGMLAAVVQPAMAPLAAAAGQAAQLKYRREFEQEADYLGVRYLQATRFDPRAMLDFFKTLEEETHLMPSFLPPYLLSHPLTDARLNHLEAVLRAKQWDERERPQMSMRLQRLQALARARFENPQATLEQYAKLRADNAANPNADYLYGVVALEIGRLEEAKQALAAARRGGVVSADRELGRIALRQRDPRASIPLLRAHLEREPADAMAWIELAKSLEVSKDTAGAKDAYRRAVSAAPDLDSAHDGYGVLAGRDGDTGIGYYHVGVAARLRGQYEKALEQLERALPLLTADAERTEKAKKQITDLQTYLEIELTEEK